MCYICSCFAWGLDLLQRVITFGLACILCGAVAFGLIVATIAGIAYGYNYSMAEFITFSRSDVTVFMRRGQFYDKSARNLRRSGAEDFFAANTSSDYEDQRPPVESKQLADKWLKTQDTRRYAEVLTRYNAEKGETREQRRAEVKEPAIVLEPPENNIVPESQELNHIPISTQTLPDIYLKPSPPPDGTKISIVPNPLIPTMSWRSGSSQIVMRNFEPLQELSVLPNMRPGALFPMASTGPQSIAILGAKDKAKERSMSYDMREWRTTARVVIPSDEPDDVDDDNIVYKPV